MLPSWPRSRAPISSSPSSSTTRTDRAPPPKTSPGPSQRPRKSSTTPSSVSGTLPAPVSSLAPPPSRSLAPVDCPKTNSPASGMLFPALLRFSPINKRAGLLPTEMIVVNSTLQSSTSPWASSTGVRLPSPTSFHHSSLTFRPERHAHPGYLTR